jgi:hypothetical protein
MTTRHPSSVPHALERPGTLAAQIAWEARIDRERACRHGPADPARLRLIDQLGAQERMLFGHVRTRWS